MIRINITSALQAINDYLLAEETSTSWDCLELNSKSRDGNTNWSSDAKSTCTCSGHVLFLFSCGLNRQGVQRPNSLFTPYVTRIYMQMSNTLCQCVYGLSVQ